MMPRARIRLQKDVSDAVVSRQRTHCNLTRVNVGVQPCMAGHAALLKSLERSSKALFVPYLYIRPHYSLLVTPLGTLHVKAEAMTVVTVTTAVLITTLLLATMTARCVLAALVRHVP